MNGRSIGKGIALIALSVASALVQRPARADEPAVDPRARADALFREAERLFQAGEIAGACATLSESYRLDPALGTLINLGLCHERQGRTATAIDEFRVALGQATAKGQTERVQVLTDEIAKLSTRLARVVFVKDFEHGVDLKLDGKALDHQVFLTPMAVDPGTHTLVVSAPGRRLLAVPIIVSETPGVQQIYLPPLEEEPAARPVAPLQVTVGPDRSRAIVGWTLVGAGVAGLGAATVLGFSALGDKSTVDAQCTAGRVGCTSVTGVDANDSARTKATVATITFLVGLAAGGAGAYLLLTNRSHVEPRGVRVAPQASATSTSIALEGRW